jgi:hypothetical protein
VHNVMKKQAKHSNEKIIFGDALFAASLLVKLVNKFIISNEFTTLVLLTEFHNNISFLS